MALIFAAIAPTLLSRSFSRPNPARNRITSNAIIRISLEFSRMVGSSKPSPWGPKATPTMIMPNRPGRLSLLNSLPATIPKVTIRRILRIIDNSLLVDTQKSLYLPRATGREG